MIFIFQVLQTAKFSFRGQKINNYLCNTGKSHSQPICKEIVKQSLITMSSCFRLMGNTMERKSYQRSIIRRTIHGSSKLPVLEQKWLFREMWPRKIPQAPSVQCSSLVEDYENNISANL